MLCKYFCLIPMLYFLIAPLKVQSQSIAVGSSSETVNIITPPNTYLAPYQVYYYKPITYNSNSPILLYSHGIGGNGGSSADLQNIADRQNALIVAPTFVGNWPYVTDAIVNSMTGCYETYYMTQSMKSIYRHVIAREGRSSMDVYLTGFSAGGQFTSRYMLVRQFSPDSIPIKMAVSLNGANYVFCTDTLNSAPMDWGPYRCGLNGWEIVSWGCSSSQSVTAHSFICDEHVKQYYNENYAVLCGDADTQNFPGFCWNGQGYNRFDRAKKLFAFSKSDAIARGTSLKWICDSVPSVGHDQFNMYNTKRNSTDTFTIVERALFKTAFHTVTQFTPACSMVGINEFTEKATEIKLFPNPSEGRINIELKDKSKLTVYDIVGRIILQDELLKGNNTIHIESSGIYIITIQNKDHYKTVKAIIQK